MIDKKETTFLQIRIEKETVEQFRAMCKAGGFNASEIIRQAITHWINAHTLDKETASKTPEQLETIKNLLAKYNPQGATNLEEAIKIAKALEATK